MKSIFHTNPRWCHSYEHVHFLDPREHAGVCITHSRGGYKLSKIRSKQIPHVWCLCHVVCVCFVDVVMFMCGVYFKVAEYTATVNCFAPLHTVHGASDQASRHGKTRKICLYGNKGFVDEQRWFPRRTFCVGCPVRTNATFWWRGCICVAF